MRKVAVIANCQGQPLTFLINTCLFGYQADYISNNVRTGLFISDTEISERLRQYDILLYQPLGPGHGKIGDMELQSQFATKPKIRFSYIFNSGTTTLGYAPMSPKNSYGEVYGENSVIDMIDMGLDRCQIGHELAHGDYSPHVLDRFANDLAIFSEKERDLEIHLAQYIKNNYFKKHLFLTHNHPTASVFIEIFLQFVRLVDPARVAEARLLSDKVIDSLEALPYTGAAITPHDVVAHGYQFGFHSDWREKNDHLIDLIWQTYKEKKLTKPSVFSSIISIPDVSSVIAHPGIQLA